MSIRVHARSGFTLIELVVFIVILSVGLVGVVSTFNLVVRSSADVIPPKQAMLVAESLLEEILLKPTAEPVGGYAANCPSICDRLRFDNVIDYDRYATTGVFSLDDLTTPVVGLENYTVAVTVAEATMTANGNGAQGRRINVAVTAAGVTHTLSGYRFNYE